MQSQILTICYLFASVTFILGLKMLSSPATARTGNRIAGLGMAIGIAGTIFLYTDESGRHLRHYSLIAVALVIGSVVGVSAAKKIKMTSMPEMVSLFNGMGGACAALISIVEFNHFLNNMSPLGFETSKGPPAGHYDRSYHWYRFLCGQHHCMG